MNTPEQVAPLALPSAGNSTPSQREMADMGTVLPLTEVAARLGVSVKTAYRKVRAGSYAGAYKVPGPSGEQWVVPVATVEQLLSKATPKSQDIVQAQALLAQVHELEVQLAQARTEAQERAMTIEQLQNGMRALTTATDTLKQAADQQRETIALTQAALQAAMNRKWWQRKQVTGTVVPPDKLQA
jgi:predicted DNA-binding transcriptional regulator YafY